MHAIYPTQDEGTRMCTAIQFGRRKGPRNVRRPYRTDMDIRGFVPELVKSDGAWGFSSAHKAAMRRDTTAARPRSAYGTSARTATRAPT